MLDGAYQSVICFFMAYLLFAPATFATESGRGVADRNRMGVYVACATISVINIYILLNTYRWDWLILLIVAISTLLIWFWTGVYSSFTSSFQFYRSAAEVYSSLTFWALTLLIIIICLLPRFSIKFFQKNYRPQDIDIIREQIRQGKFRHLDQYEAYVPPKVESTITTPESGQPTPEQNHDRRAPTSIPDSQRPIYPPSEAPTWATQNPRSQNGSDGTDKTRPSISVDVLPTRLSIDRVRSSIERPRLSMDRIRPSFEGSRDFTSAAYLTRVESSHSNPYAPSPATPLSKRCQDMTSNLR